MKAPRLFVTFVSAAVLVTGLMTGCATVKGVGSDIQSVGQAGEDAIKGK